MDSGKTLDNYKILRTLGTGASCKVKLAQDMSSGDKVAIKIMNMSIPADEEELIYTEVKKMMKLNHPNVLGIIH